MGLYGVILNKQNIKSILEDFYKLTNIRIAFYSQDQKVFHAYPQNISTFCEMIRKNSVIDGKCRECDRFAFRQAEQSGELYLYECHAGLYEAISPIILEEKLLGYLMIGQVLPQKPTEEKWNEFCKRFKFYDLDLESLRDAFFQMNYMDKDKLYAAVRMMDRNAKYIYYSKSVRIQHASKLQKINTYIADNIDKPLTVSSISSALSISKSYLNQIIRKEYNTSIDRFN